MALQMGKSRPAGGGVVVAVVAGASGADLSSVALFSGSCWLVLAGG